MRKWRIIVEAEPNGEWTTLIMLGKEVIGCATADDLTMMLNMAKELFEGCMETTEVSTAERHCQEKIIL